MLDDAKEMERVVTPPPRLPPRNSSLTGFEQLADVPPAPSEKEVLEHGSPVSVMAHAFSKAEMTMPKPLMPEEFERKHEEFERYVMEQLLVLAAANLARQNDEIPLFEESKPIKKRKIT